MTFCRSLLAALLLTALAAGQALAAGEQTGRIKGTVTDPQSGIGLPGVTVTARSPALIGGGRSVGTTDEGRYEIANLPPGQYTVEISYAGAKPLLRTVVVRQGETAPVNVSWTPEDTGVQTVTVSEPRPIAKPDSAERGTTLDNTSMARIPTGRSYQAVAQFVPGVVGGANPNIRGALAIQNRYLLDGLDITDPVTGTFSANLNFDATSSVRVLTGGVEAQYNTLGGVIDVVTAGGSEDFHANASIYVNHQDLSFPRPYGAQTYNGLQDFNDLAVAPSKNYQFNGNVGGPIVPRRLWYNVGYELRLASTAPVPGPPLGAPPYNIQHPPQESVTHLARLKLTYAPTENHRINLTASADPAHFDNSGGGDTNSYLGVAEQRQNQGGFFTIATWDWHLTPNLNTNVAAGFQVNTIENGPQGWLGSIDPIGCELFKRMDNCTYDRSRPQHFNLVDNTTWYQGDAYQNDRRYTIQIDPSISFRGRAAGFHDAKAGIQARMNYRTRKVEVPGGFQYTDNTDAGIPLEGGLCDPMSPDGVGCYRQTEFTPYDVSEKGYSVGFFIQDRWWTPITWLTVVPGLRFDFGHTQDRNGKTVSNLWGLGPRLALVADITRDGRNVVSVSYGRSNEVLSILPASNFDATEASVSIEREWVAKDHGFTNEVTRTGGPGGIVVSDKLTTPHSDEITVSARRQVFTSTLAGIDYTWKHIANIWDAVEINQIWDPTGQRVIDYVDPTKKGQAVFSLATPGDNERTYQGLTASVEGRPSRNWDFQGSYTLSWSYGPGATEFNQISNNSQFDNPRAFRYFDGFLLDDTRHVVKGYGSYQFGPVNIGSTFTYQTGGPVTKRFFNAQDGDYTRYRSPLGTEPGNGNDIKQISEFRLPDILTTNVRVMLNLLPPSLGQQLNLILDVFNAFNTRTPTALTVTDIARFGGVTARQNPLRMQLAVNYVY